MVCKDGRAPAHAATPDNCLTQCLGNVLSKSHVYAASILLSLLGKIISIGALLLLGFSEELLGVSVKPSRIVQSCLTILSFQAILAYLEAPFLKREMKATLHYGRTFRRSRFRERRNTDSSVISMDGCVAPGLEFKVKRRVTDFTQMEESVGASQSPPTQEGDSKHETFSEADIYPRRP